MSQPPNSRSSSFASGTKSLIRGVRPSVRFPSRTVASCVSDPIGTPSPRLTASTPAMNVVLTAPIPGSRTPSLPLAGAIATGPLLVKTRGSLASAFSKARRKFGAERLIGMKFARSLDQHFFGLGNVWIGDAAIDRTHRRALLLIEEADALGAFVGHDIIDVFLDRRTGRAVEFPLRAAFVDRGVGTLRLARAAIDAFFRYQRPHFRAPNGIMNSAGRTGRNENNIGAPKRGQVFHRAIGQSAATLAIRRASSRNAMLAGCAGSATVIGMPSSPARRTSG